MKGGYRGRAGNEVVILAFTKDNSVAIEVAQRWRDRGGCDGFAHIVGLASGPSSSV